MPEMLYKIEMKTPIGIRYGTMYVQTTGNEIKGYLDLMEHSEPFYGNVNKNGTCNIQGNIITLTKTIAYHAVGEMTKEEISLEVHTKQDTFYIVGKEERNEKILQSYC